jgi:hypothetical protein
MANRIKNINGVDVEMTDAEQKTFEANVVASDTGLPVRIERNQLLSETDWMAGSDVTMTDAWKTYRQALRDLPAASGFPDVDFPTKPS